MTIQATIYTNLNSNIVIKFLDNPFINDFIKQLKRINELCNITVWHETVPYKRKIEWDQEYISSREEKLRTAVRGLNSLGLNFPIQESSIALTQSEDSRKLLNKLHRYFTTSHRSVSYGENIFTWEDGTEFTFNLNGKNEYEEFKKHVHHINDAVHESEPYYINNRLRDFNFETVEHHIYFDRDSQKNPLVNPEPEYFKNIKDEHFQYFSDDLSYDVWLPLFQIQGKNYWVAYLDEDDPRCWDVTTNVIYSGSFSFTNREITKHPHIVSWFKSYGIEPNPLTCGMPLGNVISGKEIIPNLQTENILRIEINE